MARAGREWAALLYEQRRNVSRLGGRLIETLPRLYLLAAALALFYLCEDEHVAIHIHWYRDNLHWLAYGGLGLSAEDLVKPFRDFEGRARFLAYFIQALDHHLRFYLYQFTRIPVNLSLVYVPALLSLGLIYRTIFNLTGRRLAAWLGLAFYATSVGYTSGFSLLFIPAKSMTNVALVTIAWIASEMEKRDESKLFIEQPVPNQLALLATLFLAFNLDEGAFFALAIAPVLFPRMFFRSERSHGGIGRLLVNLLVYLSPLLLFLLFATAVVPMITRASWGFSFDYLGTLIGKENPGIGPAGEGLTGGFTLLSLYRNFIALLDRCFLPTWAFSNISGGDRAPLKELWLIGVVALVAAAALVAPAAERRLSHRALLLAGLYILFAAVLNGRHAIIVDGYYYANGVSVFVSLALALACNAATYAGLRGRRIAILLSAVPIACQIDYSVALARVNQMMYESFAVDWFTQSPGEMRPFAVTLDPRRGVTRWELDRIWRLWRAGHLAELRGATLSPGSVYLLFELDRIDLLKAGHVASGLLGTETIQR